MVEALVRFAVRCIPRGKIRLNQNTFSFRNLLSRYQDPSSPVQGDKRTGFHRRNTLYRRNHQISQRRSVHPRPVSGFGRRADPNERAALSPEENVIMGNAPLFHILGQTCSLATLLTGGSLILQPRINLDATFDAIQRFKAKTMIGVPPSTA